MSQNLNQAERHNAGKPQLSYIPLNLLEDCARVFEFGAQKYARDNWKKGLPVTKVLDSLMRHIGDIQDGKYLDHESGLPITGHIMCNVIFLANAFKNKPEMIDDPKLKEAWEEAMGLVEELPH